MWLATFVPSGAVIPPADVAAPASPARRQLLISKAWVQAATLVALAGFFGLVLVGFLTYQSSPPIPGRVATAGGQQLFTGADIRAGQDVFLRNGLMEYGSIFGHGAYLGPDYTADYLHRSAQIVTDQYGGPGRRSNTRARPRCRR